jgi:hypothetical protein
LRRKAFASPHHFDIRRDRRGHWVAGETFRTRDGAFRYALFEAGGDASLVHVAAGAMSAAVQRGGSRP